MAVLCLRDTSFLRDCGSKVKCSDQTMHHAYKASLIFQTQIFYSPLYNYGLISVSHFDKLIGLNTRVISVSERQCWVVDGQLYRVFPAGPANRRPPYPPSRLTRCDSSRSVRSTLHFRRSALPALQLLPVARPVHVHADSTAHSGNQSAGVWISVQQHRYVHMSRALPWLATETLTRDVM